MTPQRKVQDLDKSDLINFASEMIQESARRGIEIPEIAALRDRLHKVEDAALIAGNLLSDTNKYLDAVIRACGGVGMEYEIGLVESIDAFQDLHGELVKELGEKYARGEA